MQTALTVLIDAGILAAPRADDESSCVQYVEKISLLNELLELAKERWISVLFSNRSSAVLFDETGDYPLDKLEMFTKKDFQELLNPLLISLYSLHFEECYKASIQCHNFDSDPNLSDLTGGPILDPGLKECIILASILNQHCNIYGIRLFVNSAPDSGKIKIQASIREIKADQYDMKDIPYQPKVFRGDIVACDSLSGLLKSLEWKDITEFWKSDPNTIFETALRLAIFKYRLDSGIKSDLRTTKAPAVGSEFIKSAKVCCKTDWDDIAKKMFRCIAEIVDGLADTHWLRKDKSGNSKQVDRPDGYKAWRGEVDDHYRIHYWKKGELIELASMVHHENYTIPE